MGPETSPVVDSHVHVWDPELLEYPWLSRAGRLNDLFMPNDLKSATAGTEIRAFVFVEADRDPQQGMDEIDWVYGLRPEWPELAAIVAYAPLEEGGGVREYLERLNQRPLVKGVRRNFENEPRSFIARETTLRGAKEVSAFGYSFDACIRADQIDALADFAKQLPELPIVLDHMGKPPIRRNDFKNWQVSMRELASLSNVNVKLSGAGPESVPDQDLVPQALPYLLETLELFGPKRCMFGSDWPVSTGRSDRGEYAEWIAVVLEKALEGATAAECAAVSYRTATQFYQLESE